MSYDTPTPGSDAAREQGCKCPVIDNHYGRGRGDGQFWISENCPLHGPTGREVLDYVEHANGEITLEHIKKPADPALRSACERAGEEFKL